MDFKFPELKPSTTTGEQPTLRTGKDAWDKKCHSYELLSDNINWGTKKKPQQSPVNINSQGVQECNLMCDLTLNYKPSKCNVDKVSGDLLRLVYDKGSYIKYGNYEYSLKYIYFHTPSNHNIDGKGADMEINLYHGIVESLDDKQETKIKDTTIIEDKHNHNHFHPESDTDGNSPATKRKGVIISILVNKTKIESGRDENETRGEKQNIFLSQFIHIEELNNIKISEDPKTYTVDKEWNIDQMLPDKKSFFSYEGSIPMPPCLEEFTWVVFEEPVTIIEEYIKIIRQLGNPEGNRELHPLNNRLIYYNSNIQIEEDEIEHRTKEDIVEEKLSPIRISVDNRLGKNYKMQARGIINSYLGGANNNYHRDKNTLMKLTKNWESISQLGYREFTAQDAQVRIDDQEPNLYETLVWDFNSFNEFKYDDIVYELLKFYDGSTSSNPKNVDNYLTGYIEDINKGMEKDANKIPEKHFHKTIRELMYSSESSNSIYGKFTDLKEEFNDKTKQFTGNDGVVSDISVNGYKIFKVENVSDTPPTDKFFQLKVGGIVSGKEADMGLIMFLLMDWNISRFQGLNQRFMEILGRQRGQEALELKNDIYKHLINFFANPNSYFNQGSGLPSSEVLRLQNTVFRFKGNQLSTTLSGKTCQQWGSNKVHLENDLFSFWKKPLQVPAGGIEFDNMTDEIKIAARDGLLEYDSATKKFKRHNNCRNPNNEKGAPWCYTTDPKTRWEYCAIPTYTGRAKEYILVLVFFLIVIISIYMVKLIFRYELFSKLTSALTGGTMASQAVFGANQMVSNVKANI